MCFHTPAVILPYQHHRGSKVVGSVSYVDSHGGRGLDTYTEGRMDIFQLTVAEERAATRAYDAARSAVASS
jgi:hypothetical protein